MIGCLKRYSVCSWCDGVDFMYVLLSKAIRKLVGGIKSKDKMVVFQSKNWQIHFCYDRVLLRMQ